jgi:hypothetical protein
MYAQAMAKLTLRAHRKLMLQRALEIRRLHQNPASFDALIAWLKEKLERVNAGMSDPQRK